MLICQSLRRKSPSSRATQTCQLVFGGGYDDDDLMRSEVSPLPRPPQSATFRRLFSCPWFDLPAMRQIAFRKGRSVDVGPFHRRNVRATKRDPDRWTMRYVQPRNLADGLASKKSTWDRRPMEVSPAVRRRLSILLSATRRRLSPRNTGVRWVVHPIVIRYPENKAGNGSLLITSHR